PCFFNANRRFGKSNSTKGKEMSEKSRETLLFQRQPAIWQMKWYERQGNERKKQRNLAFSAPTGDLANEMV
ncbi:MAG: hypothetical protein PHQ50_05220, partial [Eubacteriales bacterium]|nr:hypothetical protein [Eubacteriales bacterium]